MKQQRMLIHGVILGVFCLGFGIVLAISDSITVDDIAARALEDRLNSLGQVIPDSIHDNILVENAITMKNERNKEITVYRATMEGKVTGLAYRYSARAMPANKSCWALTHRAKYSACAYSPKETPGLGDKIEIKGNWILRFDGLSLDNPLPDKWK